MYEVTHDQTLYDGFKLCHSFINGNGEKVFESMSSPHPAMQYIIGEWTLRREGWGPLAVFSSSSYAFTFRLSNGAPARLLSLHKCKFVLSLHRGLWEAATEDTIVTIFTDFPRGTLFANAVMILPEEDEF